MTLKESKAHLEQAGIERPLGLTWDKIAAMQGGRMRFPKSMRSLANPARARVTGRPCVKCGKPSGNVGLLPHCKKCLKGGV